MKTAKSKINIKLLELYLIKLRTYEKYDKKINNIINIDIYRMLTCFKKALKIIFKFDRKNKKIFFLGFNGFILHKINRNTQHIAIPPKIPLNGVFSNKLKFRNTFKYSLLKLKHKPDLIVIFDKPKNYNSFLKESCIAKIPTVTFDDNVTSRKNTFLYNIPANTEFLLHNKNLFYNCLKFLFKKPKQKTKKYKNEKKKI